MKQIQEISSRITSGRVAGNRISVDLPKEFDAQEVQIIIIPKKKVSRPAQDECQEKSVLDVLAEQADDLGPEDLSVNMDHYLYGLPKRSALSPSSCLNPV
ncbi:MAG: hypothetical protein D3908_03725 [Candidatus Electrothrix sp. AUS4]|nr:hypothetical protein [Candidatus Electrothrix sp. AUS4]